MNKVLLFLACALAFGVFTASALQRCWDGPDRSANYTSCANDCKHTCYIFTTGHVCCAEHSSS